MRIVIPNVDPSRSPVVNDDYDSLKDAVEDNMDHLRGADLRGADLRDMDLDGADLQGADLRGADLRGANLTCATLARCNLRGAKGLPAVPVVEKIHTKILAQVETGNFDMRDYHTCNTIHCWAGWAVHLAGDAGYRLEYEYDSDAAGALILLASSPELDGKVPNFYGTNEEAIAEIRRLAALEAKRA